MPVLSSDEQHPVDGDLVSLMVFAISMSERPC